MAKTIKEVFAEAAADAVIDAALIKRIHDFERAFVNRSEDHIKFFGGNLMGVTPLRFKPSDKEAWFNDVIGLDELTIVDGIKQVEAIGDDWTRANDPMNHSVCWLLYALQNAPKLSPSQKEQACIDTLLIWQYKFLGSLMAHFFKFPADEQIMQMTYSALSRKYAIKVAGSWHVLLLQRAQEILKPSSIHHNTYMNLGPDKAVVYMINDVQGRLREIVKSYAEVFHQMHKSGSRISSDSAAMDIDGTAVLQDRSRKWSTYLRYLHEVLDDRQSFVRDELVDVISDAQHTMPPRLLTEALNWMSLNHRVKGFEKIDELVDETLIHAFDLMQSNRDTLGGRGQLMPLLTKLRALYMASRMSDVTLLKTKELAEWVVDQSVASKNASVVASVRTGVQLYLVLRALAMHRYQN